MSAVVVNKKMQFLSVAIIYLGEVSIGYLVGWGAPALTKLQSPTETTLSVPIDIKLASLIGPTYIMGAFFGAQLSGYFSNLKGRRYCLFIGSSICTAAYLLLAVSTEIWMLFLGNALLGLGAGPVFILNLTYIAEVSSKNHRGVFLTGIGTANAIGIVFVYSIGPYISYFLKMFLKSKNHRGVFLTGIGTANAIGLVFVYSIGPYISYAAINYIGLLLNAMFTVGLFCIPESPVFNVMNGNEIKARKALLKLGRSEEVEDVLSVATSANEDLCASLTAIVSSRSNRKAMFIAGVLLAMQQMSGRITVILYGTSIFKSAGSTISPALATIGTGLSELVASCIAPLIAGKVGRKLMMLVSSAVCALSMVTVAIFFYIKSIQPQLAEKVYWLPLVSLVIFLQSYALGFGIIPNSWMSEMLDSKARGPGSAIALSFSWIFCFINTSAFGYMTASLGSHWTFGVYALSCAIAFVFTAVVVPEIRGKTLTEIQHMLSK